MVIFLCLFACPPIDTAGPPDVTCSRHGDRKGNSSYHAPQRPRWCLLGGQPARWPTTSVKDRCCSIHVIEGSLWLREITTGRTDPMGHARPGRGGRPASCSGSAATP